MKLVYGIVVLDLVLAALGALSAWYIGATWAYMVCAEIALCGLVLPVFVKAYDSIKASWTGKEK